MGFMVGFPYNNISFAVEKVDPAELDPKVPRLKKRNDLKAH